MPPRRIAAALLRIPARLGVCVVLLAGCDTINEGIGLTITKPLPALSDSTQEPPLIDARSFHSFDRRAWGTVVVEVPVRQVDNRPTYVANLHWPAQPEAWAPAYPDAEEALVAGTDTATDTAHLALDPLYAAGLAAVAPIHVLIRRPWTVERSPEEPYQRVATPEAGIWSWVDFEPAPAGEAAEPAASDDT